MADQPETAGAAEAAEPATAAFNVPNLWHETLAPHQQAVLKAQLRRHRAFRVLAVMLALALLIVVMLWWLSPIPHPYFAGLWITSNESKQIPLPFQTNRDRDALRDGGYFRRTSPNAFQNLNRETLLRELSDLARRSPADAVVVYLSAQARTGPQGDVQVLPLDADLGNPQTWVPLREVLTRVKACPAHRKLVVLDIMAPLATARLGVPADDVSAAVPADLDAVPDPHRLTLCAAAPGQTSVASEVMGRTVFGYYLEEALRGWADGYGPGPLDRRVSVQELAEFVKARVDRWTWQNRLVRQTPTLYGGKTDFDLIVVPQGKPLPHLGAVDAPEYPNWLAEGWKTRDKWWAEEAFRTVPQLTRELDVTLLGTEQEWLQGVELTAGRDNRPLEIKGVTARKALFRFPPQPETYSLSLAEAQGRKPNPEVLAQLRELVYKTKAAGKDDKDDKAKDDKAAKDGKAEPGAEKAKLDALEQIRAKPHAEVALAGWDLIANDADLQPARVLEINSILAQQEVRPRYVETLFLQQLANALAGEQNWPRETVQQALTAARLGERAASHAEAVDWIRPLLNEASQRRHEGETIFFARGYAPPNLAEPLLQQAATAADAALAVATTLQRARRTLDDALAFLPAAVPFVERLPRHQRDWSEAVQLVDELYQAMVVPDLAVLTADQRRQRVDDVRSKTDELLQRLIDLRRPFAPSAWASLKDAAARPDAGVFHVLEIDTLLSAPFLKADERTALLKTYQALTRRLHDQTRKLDEAEDAKTQTVTTKFTENDGGRRTGTESDRAALRSRLAIDLLRLAGAPAADLQPLDAQLQRARETGAAEGDRRSRWYALGLLLRKGWLETLPDQVGRDPSLLLRDRVSRVWCPPEFGLPPGDSEQTPQITLRQQESRKLWAWLADRYRYLSRDALNLGQSPGGAPALYAAAARPYQQALGTVAEEEYVEMTGPGAVDVSSGLAVRYPLQLRLYTPSQTTDAVMRIVPADNAWLGVVPDDPRDAGKLVLPHLSARRIPLRVEVNADAARQEVPPPRGFLVEVTFNGRTYHHLVPLGLQSVSERVEILLSTNPNQPTAPVGELRLRPVRQRQPYYLYLSNPTSRARNLFVQLTVNDAPVANAETKVVLGPRETRRVTFPQPAAPPTPAVPPGTPAPPLPDLPDLVGPLEIRVTDTDTKLVEKKLVAAGVASPREYIQVTSIQYNPSLPTDRNKNRLSASLRSLLAGGPPCLAELALPADRIPGLLNAPEGNLRGEVPAGGVEELKLYAENLQLHPDADEEGYVYLHIDTLPRAFVFRTTFVRNGEPTTPREDNVPALRVRAPRVGITGQKLPVDVEVDNAPPGSKVDVSIGTLVAGLFEPETTRRLATAQESRVGFTPGGPNGALWFEAMIRDWHVEMDTLRIKGRRTLMARLTDGGGQVIRTAMTEVVLDDSPAEKVRLVDVPAKWRNKEALPLQASGVVPVAGLKEVNFFFGKPVDNKLPPNTPTFPGAPVNETRTDWAVKLPLAGERKGPTDVSVEFKSATGLSSFATATLELIDQEAPPETGRIEGKVAEGPRAQEGLTVVLRDEKNEVRGQTTTDADGAYKFENVKPGKYRVIASKPKAKRTADKPVDVAPGATVRLDLTLGV